MNFLVTPPIVTTKLPSVSNDIWGWLAIVSSTYFLVVKSLSSVGVPSWDNLPWYQALPSQSNVWALLLALSAVPLPTMCAYVLAVSSILYLPWTCWFDDDAIVLLPSACESIPLAVVKSPSTCEHSPLAVVLLPSAWE